MLLVVAELQLPPALRLGDGPAHRVGDLVGVHDHLAVDVAGGPADRLDQRGLRPEEALLVGVEDGHQRHLGQVEALPEEVDADEHVVLPQPEVAEDLDALDGVDVGVEVADPEPLLEEVVGEVLGHLLGEGGDEDAVAALGALPDLLDEVVDLALGGAHQHLGIDEAGGPHDLLGHLGGHLQLVRARAWPRGTRPG